MSVKQILTIGLVFAATVGAAAGRVISGEEAVASVQALQPPRIPPASIPLEGAWRFRTDPAGTAVGWASAALSDASWRLINAPGDWEGQGITDPNPLWKQDTLKSPYSGYAWYRTSVVVPAVWKGRKVYLNLGYIDDFDWTFFNGVAVGQTTTQGQATDGIARAYSIPASLIKFGQRNVVAVKVLDVRGKGGIATGPLSLTIDEPVAYSALGGERKPDSVRVGSDLVIGPDKTTQDAVAVMGDIIVEGHVNGDAVAVMGDVEVKPGGNVQGDAVAVGGNVYQSDGGTVRGEITSLGLFSGRRHAEGPAGIRWLTAGLWNFWKGLSLLVFAVMLTALFPLRMRMVSDAILEQPGLSIGYGAGGAAVLLFAAGLMLITCIGAPLVALEAVFVVAIICVGGVGANLAIGDGLSKAVGRPLASAVISAAVGSVIVELLRFVPFAGIALILMLYLVGFGATILTGFGTAPDWMQKRINRSPPAAYPPPPPAPVA